MTNRTDVRGDLLENNANIAANERNESEKAADKKAELFRNRITISIEAMSIRISILSKRIRQFA